MGARLPEDWPPQPDSRDFTVSSPAHHSRDFTVFGLGLDSRDFTDFGLLASWI
jgi:hypothetical protein